VEATFDLTAYYVSTEKLQKPAATQPAGSGSGSSGHRAPSRQVNSTDNQDKRSRKVIIMKNLNKSFQYSLAILGFAACFAFGGEVSIASVQDKPEVPASRANRGGRDPFSKYVPAPSGGQEEQSGCAPFHSGTNPSNTKPGSRPR